MSTKSSTKSAQVIERRRKYKEFLNKKHMEILQNLRKDVAKHVGKLEDFPGTYCECDTEDSNSLTGRDHDNVYHIVTNGSFHVMNKILEEIDNEIEDTPKF